MHRVLFAAIALFPGSSALFPILLADEPAKEVAQPSLADDAFLAKCTKILSYGDTINFQKPSKSDAVIALGLLGDERAVPVLIDHLENEENKQLRLQIVKALGWIGSATAVPALESALKDSYPFVRQQAAMALKAITGKDYDFDRTGLPDLKKLRETIRSQATQP
jgi:HEAT repeat protein